MHILYLSKDTEKHEITPILSNLIQHHWKRKGKNRREGKRKRRWRRKIKGGEEKGRKRMERKGKEGKTRKRKGESRERERKWREKEERRSRTLWCLRYPLKSLELRLFQTSHQSTSSQICKRVQPKWAELPTQSTQFIDGCEHKGNSAEPRWTSQLTCSPVNNNWVIILSHWILESCVR